MKNTQLIDTIRNIKKEFISYLSIVIIALLAVASFLGINFAAGALKNTADSFFHSHSFRDFEITSTMLMDEEDIADLEALEGVEKAEKVYTVSAFIRQNDLSTAVSTVSLTEELNTVTLKSGRLPEKETECVLEDELMRSLSLKEGMWITVTDASGNVPKYLKQKRYQIVGSVLHPDHYARKTFVPGDRYVLVLKEAFDLEELDGSFMKAIVRAEGIKDLSFYSRGYQKISGAVKEELKSLTKEMAARRTEKIRQMMQDKIDEGEAKLAEAKTELSDARKELNDNASKLEDAIKKIEEAKAKLAEGLAQLEEGNAEAAYYAQVLVDAQGKIASAKTQLAEGKAALDDAEKQLAEGKAVLDDAEKQLAEGKAQLDAGKEQLDTGKKLLDEGNEKLTQSYNDVEKRKDNIRNALIEVVTFVIGEEGAGKINWATAHYAENADDPSLTCFSFAITEDISFDLSITVEERVEGIVRTSLRLIGEEEHFEEVMEKIRENETFIQIDEEYDHIIENLETWETNHTRYLEEKQVYEEKQREYEEGLALYNEKKAQYEEGLALYNEKKAQYEEGLALYNEKKAQYEDGLRQYNDALAQYNEGLALLGSKWQEYYDGLAEVQEGERKIEEGQEAIAEGEEKYAEGMEEYNKGVTELNNAKKELANLPDCFYILLDARGNGGFLHADVASDNVSKVGITFAFIFVIVGALVIYVTLGRIIGEQRTLVGAQKALGFFSREVLEKYTLFGVTATILGMILGTGVGYFLVQRIVTRTYRGFYVVSRISNTFLMRLFVIVIVAGIFLSILAVWWACHSLLRQTARELMQLEAPKGKKKEAGRSDSGKGLYSRLIFRNMVTDWRRVLITTISIAGCCTLLVIGFHMRSSIDKTIDIQFSRQMRYEQEISFDPGKNADVEKEISQILSENKIASAGFYSGSYGYETKDGISLGKIYVADPETIRFGYALESAEKKHEIVFDDSGVLISRKIADNNGLERGGTLTLYDTDMTPHEVRITDIYDAYFGNDFFMTDTAFRNIFGRAPKDNTLWTAADLNKKEMNALLKGVKGYEGISVKSDTKRMFASLAKVLNVITLVLIVAAGMMAYFVLLNLINMYLNRKKRELVVMRINGFTVKEVIRYVSIENIVTTVLGIFLGLVLGTVLGNIILGILEQDTSSFYRGISVSALVAGAAITALFALVINLIALRKVKHLKLNDM